MDKNSFTEQNRKDFSLNRLICISAIFLALQFITIFTLYAQSQKFSLNKENATFEEIFKEIEAKTGQKMTTAQLQKIITETGYTPVQRDSLYRKIK